MKKGSSRTQRFTKTQAAEFKRRRRALMRIMGDNAIALIPSARECIRSRDTEYRYRADSNLLYLTGFDEPESLMVLIPNRKAGQYIMFCRERDELKETWQGRRLGVEDAPEALGADDAFPIGDIDDILPGLLENKQSVYHTLGKNQAFDAQVLGWLNKARSSRSRDGGDPDSFISLDYHLHEMRLFKSRAEIQQMKQAAKLSAAAHGAVMKAVKPGMLEYELEAILVSQYKSQGAEHAFLPIVGSGANGCILHYTENNDTINDKELVLVDSGAELGYYAGDITRTFPANGTFSKAQKILYNIVLEAQLAAIEKTRPGNHWNEPHEAAIKVLTRGLRDIGVLKGKLTQLIKDEAYKPFYMHKTGHWLGMDVHDVGEYRINGDWRVLEPGMVITVEPGLYLGNSRKIPKDFRDTGIRIEDDVVVTKNGCEIITDGVPKTVADIEAWMGHS
ncbi:MAG: aminopeptidase P N-terminal domain-containing protein [Granulosicoccus sp.]